MKKKILFLTPGLGKGGAETQLLKIARYCDENDIRVTILSLKPIDDFDVSKYIPQADIIFLQNWKSHWLLNIKTLRNTLTNFEPDAVVAFMFIGAIFGRILKLRFKFKLISSVRNSVISNKWYQLFKLTYRLDDITVFNAEASKRNFVNKKLTRETSSIVINNGISLVKKLPYSTNDCFIWICMAHFRPSKDYHTLLKAVSLIKSERFKLQIFGHMHEATWPKELVETLNIGSKVHFYGFKADVSEYLAKADALVLSSFNEGMPNAILEAMSHSKPVIGSDIDGVRELLIESGGGLLFKKGNAQDLADKMDLIMALSENERIKLGDNGRNFVENQFAEETVMNKWLNILQTV